MENPDPQPQASADALIKTANQLVKTNKPEEAIAFLRKAVATDPKLPIPCYSLGIALAATNKSEAIEWLHRAATNLKPGTSIQELRPRLGLLQMQRALEMTFATWSSSKHELFTEAVQNLQRAVEADPANMQFSQWLEAAREQHEKHTQQHVDPVPAAWARNSRWLEDSELLAELDATGVLECNVKQLWEFNDWSAFDKDYRQGVGVPALLVGASNNWRANIVFADKFEFLKKYGGVKVPVRWPAGAWTWGLIERIATVEEYVKSMHEPEAGMLFGNACKVEESDQCAIGYVPAGGRDWHGPAVMDDADTNEPGLSLAPSRRGLPWHNHESAWESVAVGKKLVLLLPPMTEVPRELHMLVLPSTLEFVRRQLALWPDLQHVLLEPGDVLWIPCNWWHATLNIGDTVALGGQKRKNDPTRLKKHCAWDVYHSARDQTGRAVDIMRSSPLEAVEILEASCGLMSFHLQCALKLFEARLHSGQPAAAVTGLREVIELFEKVLSAGQLSTMQLSVNLDVAADALTQTRPQGAFGAGGAVLSAKAAELAASFLERAIELQPLHNIKARVGKAVLSRQESDHEAALTALAAADAGEVYWYRTHGAHGGISVPQLRQQLQAVQWRRTTEL
jgi:tetratricopeptide (TPR) repeat protein